MSRRVISKTLFTTAAMAMVLSPLASSASLAQPYSPPPGDYPPPQGGYDNRDAPPPPGDYDERDAPPPGSYDNRDAPPPGSYDNRYAPPPGSYSGQPPAGYYDSEPPPPPGYDGRQAPPPPPGYQPGPDDAQWQARDQQYAGQAEDWARRYCVKSGGNAGAGALIGGVIGAIVGSGLSGRHDRAAGTIVGAGVGAVGGAAIASGTGGQTSPGCPPGYVVRRDAPVYAYPSDYDYYAPSWYRPWVFVDGAWLFRPYPYHHYYYRHFYRGGYRGGYRGHRGW